MKKINNLLSGVASLFCVTSTVNVDAIFDKYPTNNDDAKEELIKNWKIVGNAIQGAINTYEQEKN